MFEKLSSALISSSLFALLGIIILLVVFVVIEKIAPENLWKEIIEKQNTALAILGGAFMVAMSIIIGMAIHG